VPYSLIKELFSHTQYIIDNYSIFKTIVIAITKMEKMVAIIFTIISLGNHINTMSENGINNNTAKYSMSINVFNKNFVILLYY